MKAGGKIISLQPPSLSSSWGITIAEKLLVTKQHQSRFLMGVVAARYYVQIFFNPNHETRFLFLLTSPAAAGCTLSLKRAQLNEVSRQKFFKLATKDAFFVFLVLVQQ